MKSCPVCHRSSISAKVLYQKLLQSKRITQYIPCKVDRKNVLSEWNVNLVGVKMFQRGPEDNNFYHFACNDGFYLCHGFAIWHGYKQALSQRD